MHTGNIAFAAFAAILVSGVADAAMKPRAVAHMKTQTGAAAGQVDFLQTNHGVLITYDIKGLRPGVHAIHIHTSGNCDPKVKFTSAGPHFSPQQKMHGFMTRGGPHAGDLPNEFAASDGTLHAATMTTAFALGNGKKSIFDRDGAAIVVHAGADDYSGQPAGNSGDRIACGVIVRTVGPAKRRAAQRTAHK
ncbi:MAG TPA: superoxide dismutase family protein [Rhizomicrobium sp.]|nr:superoxide dismutase family protein [Rhizomicrobium sp.]